MRECFLAWNKVETKLSKLYCLNVYLGCSVLHTTGTGLTVLSCLCNCSTQEGVCILSGLGYNGRGEDGQPQWDACANMRVWLFETTPLFTGTINSFNINTNAWVARYTPASYNETSDFNDHFKTGVHIVHLFLCLWPLIFVSLSLRYHAGTFLRG